MCVYIYITAVSSAFLNVVAFCQVGLKALNCVELHMLDKVL